MLRFLSDEWLRQLETALRAALPAPSGEAGAVSASPRLALGQVVRSAPGGDERSYTIRLGGGEPPAVEIGTTGGADVVLVTDLASATALARGDRTPAELLAAGAIKVRGDANALIAAQGAVAALVPALASLASRTEFPGAGAPDA